MFNQDILPRSAPGLKKYSLLPLRMLQLMLVVVLLTLVTGSKCPNENLCGEQQTCCQIPSGEYTCCPFHQGECCEDHLHCCPEGMLCHVTESKCSNTTHSVGWTERLFASHAALPKSFRMIGTSTASKDTTTCPDESSCPAEFSCLQLPKGYGCCPLAQGIVCSDGKHCCPNDHQCSADSTSCVKKREPVRAVICADGISECPLGTTCCESADRTWSCCPVPRAVCCADKLHCCPEDSVCHVNASKCVSSTQQELPMWSKFPARLRADWEDHKSVTTTTKMTPPPKSSTVSKTATSVGFALSKGSDVPCDDTVSCPDGSTCCKDGQGGWGCCPFSQAVCCDDFVHCCPHGKKCNLTAQTCEDPSGSVPWLKKEPSRIRVQKVPETKGSDVPCDDTVSCPDGSTCCKDGQGGWGCCPFSQAVCCDDFVHCCPHGKKCNLTAQTCEDPSGSIPWLKKEPSRIRVQKVPETKGSDVPCDDTVSCPDGSTCCKDGQGGWGCCPFSQAVCCDDFVHCCPHGKKCNLTAQTCEDPSGSVPWLKKEPSRIRVQKVPETKGSDVPCDDTVSCPDGSTCCKDGQGGWGCCPFSQAVCCDDFVHCCPHGKKCNLTAQTCEDPSGSVPWLKKEPSRIRVQKVPETKGSDVPCDDTVSCPDGSTCCKDGQGGWGCCPFSQAVCCDDFVHCCPHGKKCNLTAQTCEDPSGSVPWLKKEPSRIRVQKVPETKGSDVPCDDTVSCPDGSTCCKDGQGGWGCCPFSQAVCCDDFVHCCPHGKKCNLTAQTCEDPSGSIPWLKKEPSRIRVQKVPETKGSDVPCDDTVSCPDGSTCCKDGQGGWGCCPFSQAVCCDDFVHCCPHGKKCNLTAQTCEDPSGSIPWLKKEPSRIRVQKVPETKGSDVPCDDTVSCPDGSTCCKDGQGGWGCCPFSQAVCCDDFVHCCPHGKKCNLTAQTCEDPSGSVPWLKKEPSHPRADQKASSDIKCDSSHSCLESSTCCKDFDSNWRCCPFPQGVCCQDHFHCCPHDSTCNLATLTCNNSSGSVPMGVIENTSSPPVQKKQKTTEDGGHGDVKCDEHTFCPEHTTCCFIQKSQKWGCCPLDKALCCEDGEHCCPEHYTCDKTQATCIKGAVAVPWYTKLPAQTRPAPGLGSPGPRCDKQTSCSVGQSCCRLSRDKWGCCPLPEATCCSDGEHCCPTGYTCDVDSGSCVKTIWLQVETVPLTQIHSLQSDIQCGGEFSCKDEETCCKTSDTTWGCCPSPEAVCCSDMKHCCPAGYTCSDEGMCAKGTDFSWDTWQVFFSKKKRAVVL